MNNLSSYCGLVDAKIRAADKDLPVMNQTFDFANELNNFSNDDGLEEKFFLRSHGST